MGRIKFSEEICNEVCSYREEGLSMKYCADLAGIHRNTLTNWINKGKKAKSGKYHDFFLKWNRATAKFMRIHQNHIANSDSWLAHQYLMQVTDPEAYVVEKKVNAGLDVNTNFDELFNEEDIKRFIDESEYLKEGD